MFSGRFLRVPDVANEGSVSWLRLSKQFCVVTHFSPLRLSKAIIPGSQVVETQDIKNLIEIAGRLSLVLQEALVGESLGWPGCSHPTSW